MSDTLLEKPTRPEDWECCGGGCSPCVWDNYYADMERWQQQQKAQAEKNKSAGEG
ncbi:MAG: oxidoreductase-like domain-containing protein [Motiliproteus sp.]|nr:oxidoreductase-like domain-containing protein [Motiliproteus sp.]